MFAKYWGCLAFFISYGLIILPVAAQTILPNPPLDRLPAPSQEVLPDQIAPLLPTPELPQLPAPPFLGGDRINVLRYEVLGSTVFSSQELAAVTQSFTGQVTFEQLQAAQQAIDKLYLDRQYLTTGSYIPTGQVLAIDGAVVKIQVVEGRLEDIKVTGNQRLNANYIKARLAVATAPPLNNERLLEGLRLLQQDPLLENIAAELSAGIQPGTNLLEIKVRERDSFTGEIATNNNRSTSIGTNQRRVQITEANLTGAGDSLTLAYGNTDGSNSIDTSYSIPLSPQQTTLTVNVGGINSQIIAEPFRSLNITTNSRYYEASLRQPLIRRAQRDATQELAVGLTAAKLESSSAIDGTPLPLSSGADVNGRTSVSALRLFQEYVQKDSSSVLSLRSQLNLGIDALGATVNNNAPDSRFVSWQGQGRWLKRWAADTDLVVQGRVQLADRPLVSLEQFAIGGQGTVRGYRQDALLADNGAFVSAELQLPISSSVGSVWQVAPFVDVGTVWNNAGANPSGNTLLSTGLGLQWRTDQFTARLDWGIPLINIPDRRNSWQESGFYFSVRYFPF
jgi:hemolysin activation/secretion protein